MTVFADDKEKYLTTDLTKHKLVRDGYLAKEVQLTGLSTLPHICELRTPA